MFINKSESVNNIINNIEIKILDHGMADLDTTWFYNDMISPFNRLYFIEKGSGYLKIKDSAAEQEVAHEKGAGYLKIRDSMVDSMVEHAVDSAVDSTVEHVIELEPGNVYLIPCNMKFSYFCRDYLRKFYTHVNILYYGVDIFNNLNEICKYRFDSNMDFISNTGDSLSNAFKLKCIISEVVYYFFKQNEYSINNYIESLSKYLEIYKYISDNLDSELKIADICRYFSYSNTTLYKMFKNDNAMSLKKYIEAQLVNKIQRLLVTSKKTIKEIACELKFCDEYYLSKFFKKFTDMTPLQYRKKYRF